MADLSVDLDGLQRLVSHLANVVSWLEVEDGVFQAERDALGEGRLVDALHDFNSHWHDGRKHVKDGAESMMKMASTAVAAFRSTDHELAAQLAHSMAKK